MAYHHRRAPQRRHDYGPRHGRSRSRSSSGSRSPDPELARYLAEQAQARPASPSMEEHRRQRIAAGGVFNVKSRHERERDEAERKKREEEENAVKAFREFVADMESAGGSRGSKNRDGRPGYGRPRGGGFVQAGGSAYAPTVRPQQQVEGAPAAPRAMRDGFSQSGVFGEEEQDRQHDSDRHERREQEQAVRRDPPGKRKGAMQDFLGELQRNQAMREDRLRDHITESSSVSSLLAQEMKPAQTRPRDELDASSSNICILNLPANVSETSFGQYFSQFGDVGSVKIMWPRIEDNVPLPSSIRTTKHPGATGFINYMRRRDAEVAYREMDGAMWGGCQIHTAWGKSLPKPHVPLYMRADYQRSFGSDTRRDERAPRDRKRRSSRSPGSRNHRRKYTQSANARESLRKTILQEEDGTDLERDIVAVASRVREYGARFENMVKEREGGNPRYSFLEASDSCSHQYYRCLLDDHFEPRVLPEGFQDEGDASFYSSDTEEDSEWEKLQARGSLEELGKAARRRLDAMLRGLTLRRERIARIMMFAIDHASAAEAVTDRLIGSAMVPTTPLSRKLARLFVISDILHNSTQSGAWRYRSLFESRLGPVFAHWGDVANSFPGRIKREACRDMARAVLAVWETWLVFELPRLAQWRALVDHGSGRGQAAAEDDQPEDSAALPETEGAAQANTSAIVVDEDLDGGEIDGATVDEASVDDDAIAAKGAAIDGEAIDGQVIDEQAIDGQAIDGQAIDGQAIDGQAIEDDPLP